MKKMSQFVNYFFIGFSFLANKKLVAILTICLFMSLINVSTGYREELLLKEQEMMFEKPNSEVLYYNDTVTMNSSASKKTGALELVTCWKKGIDTDILRDTIKEKIQQLNNLYAQNDNYFSFLYKDLYTGFTVSYNEKAPIFTASTIKAPAMIYLYEQVSQNQVSLDEKLVYQSKYYHDGSGVLKTKETNTRYPVRELIHYAIHDSDNIAYAMLMDRFQRKNMLTFWQQLGTEYIFTLDTIWGVTSAHDAAIYMQELYHFYLENEEYGEILMNEFQNAEWKMLTNREGEYRTSNKGGWSGKTFHDVAIVWEENPYILVVMSNTGESDYRTLFSKTSILVGELHEEYWHQKEAICSQIKQY